MESRTKLILAGVFIALILLIGLGVRVALSSPQYSLYQMYGAVKEHNYEKFKKYVDIDSVTTNVVDKAIESAKQNTDTTSGNVWENLGATFAVSLFDSMKPGFKTTLTSTIQKAVEEGTFKSDYKPKNIIQIFQMISVKRDGKVADITIKAKGVSDLHIKMRNLNGYWQVFDMDLPAPSTNDTSSSETTTQAKYGDRVDISQGWFLTVEAPTDYVNPNEFEQPKSGNKNVAIKVSYENTTDKPDSFSISNFKLKDDKDFSYSRTYGGKTPALEDSTLEAHGKVNGYLTFEIPTDTQSTSVVYSGTKSVVFK